MRHRTGFYIVRFDYREGAHSALYPVAHRERRRICKMVKRAAILVVLGLVTAALLLSGGTSTQAQATTVWAKIDLGLPATTTLTGVFMVDGAHGAWAVGADGNTGLALRMQRQGGSWTVQSRAVFRAPLRAVAVIGDDNVWAVGDAGLIVHRDSNGWHEVANPAPTGDLTTIQMFGQGEEGWAGGSIIPPRNDEPLQGLLLHYQYGIWQRVPPPQGYSVIQSLHFAGGGGWAVGSLPAPDASIARYEDGAWITESGHTCPQGYMCDPLLNAVRAITHDEAWAVGYNSPGHGYRIHWMLMLHRLNGQWQEGIPGGTLVDDPINNARKESWLSGLSFSSAMNGLAVGVQKLDLFAPMHPLILSYQADGRWHYESVPYIVGGLNAVSHADAMHALAVGTNGLILGYGYGGPAPAPWPTATPTPTPLPRPTPVPWPPTVRVPDPHLPNVLYFPAAGHSLQGGFRVYWEAHGGLGQFGYPITEEFTESDERRGVSYKVQYFERARFEWHPENRPPYDVLLGLLGRTITAGRVNEPPFQPAARQTTPGGLYFPETQHNLAPQFVAYWQSHGGLPVYGYPISEAFTETSPTDGKPYLVQYFERNRLEYHPELPDPFRVSLGLLGVQVLQARGWLP
jgi:hypothetical protein